MSIVSKSNVGSLKCPHLYGFISSLAQNSKNEKKTYRVVGELTIQCLGDIEKKCKYFFVEKNELKNDHLFEKKNFFAENSFFYIKYLYLS